MITQHAREFADESCRNRNLWGHYGPLGAKGSYRLLPIEPGEKRCLLKGWPDRGVPKLGELAAWATRPAANIGLALGRHPLLPSNEHVVAIDIDFLNRAARRAAEAIVRRGAPGAPLRRGSLAKAGAFFVRVRAEEGETIALPQGGKFTFADTPEGKGEMVEVLGAGRQAVIHGIHPSGVAYEWEDGRSILDMPAANLPCLTVAQLAEMVAEIDAAAAAEGGTLVQSGRIVSERQVAGMADLAPLDRELSEELTARLRTADNDMTREDWVMHSKAVWHLTKETLGEEIVRAALEDFHARYGGFDGDHEPLYRVLAEVEPPAHYGLRQVVRSLGGHNGWDLSPDMRRRLRRGDAKLDFEGVPFSITDMHGSTDEPPRHLNDNSGPGSIGRARNAPKSAPADLSENADALAAMNEKHALVRVGSGVAVASFGEPGTVPTLMPKYPFLDLMAPNKLRAADGRRVPIAPVWFSWERRRTYLGGLRMLPQGINAEGLPVPSDVLNTWMGYVTAPADADGSDWSLIQGYLRNIVCAGDRNLYVWLLNWLAHLVQFPHEKPGTALILKGPQGAGKTTLTELLRAIFHPAHVVGADRPEALLGNFNAHLREALVVIADEAVFAGDPAANNRLKAFVTDSTVTIEQKGIDSVSVPSFHRLVMTSNEDHVIRAETDARRWAVFDVSGDRSGDAAYFRALYGVLKSGHPEVRAFLRDLAVMVVDRDTVRRAPTTGGLIGQVVQSLPAPQQWLFELMRDALPATNLLTPHSAATTVPYEPSFGDGTGEWPAYATREALARSYGDWVAGHRYARGNSTNALGNVLKLFGPPLQVKGSDSGRRRRVVRLGDLSEARAAFAAAHLRGVNDASVWGAEDEIAVEP